MLPVLQLFLSCSFYFNFLKVSTALSNSSIMSLKPSLPSSVEQFQSPSYPSSHDFLTELRSKNASLISASVGFFILYLGLLYNEVSREKIKFLFFSFSEDCFQLCPCSNKVTNFVKIFKYSIFNFLNGFNFGFGFDHTD